MRMGYHLYRLIFLIVATMLLFPSCRQETAAPPDNPALNLIPSDAVLILESDTLANFLGALNHAEPLSLLLPQAGELAGESLLRRAGVVSYHQTFRDSYQYLMILTTPDRDNPADYQRMVERLTGKTGRRTERKYSGEIIYRIDFEKDAPISSVSLTILNRFLILSPSPILVENAIRLQAEPPLKERIPAIGKLTRLRDHSGGSRLLVNLESFPKLVGSWLTSKSDQSLRRFNRYGEWAGLDLTYTSQSVVLNGPALPGDTVNSYLNIFTRQKPVMMTTARNLPIGTAAFLSVGIDQPETYLKLLSDCLGGRSTGVERQRVIARNEKQTSMRFVEDWKEIGFNELTLAWIPADSAGPDQPVVVVAARNRSKLFSLLEKWNSKAEISHPQIDTSLCQAECQPMAIERLPLMLGGGWFDQVQGSWYAISDNLLILADNPQLIDQFIRHRNENRVLITDPLFLVMSERFPSRSNLTGYVVPSRVRKMVKEMLKPELVRWLDMNPELFENIGAISFQANSRDGSVNHDLALWLGQPPVQIETGH